MHTVHRSEAALPHDLEGYVHPDLAHVLNQTALMRGSRQLWQISCSSPFYGRTCLYNDHHITCRPQGCQPNTQPFNYGEFNGKRQLRSFHAISCVLGCFSLAPSRDANAICEHRCGSVDDIIIRCKVPILANYDRASLKNFSRRSRATGPGVPLPIVRLSTLTTGITSAAVPVRKHSSAT